MRPEADQARRCTISSYSLSTFPLRVAITRDRAFDLGIMHRLDANSSGLLLGATSYAAYFRLHWALHTYQIQREYVALCHRHVDPRLNEIRSRLIIRGGTSHVTYGAGSP